NIGCATADYMLDHHMLLVGRERDEAIRREATALESYCAITRPMVFDPHEPEALAIWRERLRQRAERRIDHFLAWGAQVTEHSLGRPCP
ncbi:MAG TPA: hypothetical protein VN851_05445, partial [Thermoanaerobaculia bacterium]|nr:hypothetical protein [Thermoanaerobaculia bacterium]